MQLLQGFGGSGGEGVRVKLHPDTRAVHELSRSFTGDVCAGEGTPVGNIVQILLGLAKSYFNIKGKTNTSIQVRAVLGQVGTRW